MGSEKTTERLRRKESQAFGKRVEGNVWLFLVKEFPR